MYLSAIIESMSDNSAKENITNLKLIIPELDGNLDLVLLQNYPDIEDLNKVELDQLNIHQHTEYYSELVNIASRIACEFSVYLSPGVLLDTEGDNIYLSSVLLNPEGEVILKQKQLFICSSLRFTRNILKAGKNINYAETDLGKIGLMLGSDCWHPEVGRVMALENVDLVIAVNSLSNFCANLSNERLFNDIRGNPWQQLAGVWSQVQQNQFFALEASVDGQNLIHAPCEITQYRTGILAPVGTEKSAKLKSIEPYFEDISEIYREINGFRVITAEIDLYRLQDIRKAYPLMKYLNKPLYCKEMGGGDYAG
ncbi:MAG: nitrilase-related carbon-nitrogen hydrolase [Halanaerobiales bacterium]